MRGLMVTVCPSYFFQAEDGIRDYKVTGVQTCALPIYTRGHQRPHGCLSRAGRRTCWPVRARRRPRARRSEERRVGKECRSRWSPYHLKKKMVTVCPSQFATRRTLFHVLVSCVLLMLKVSRLKLPVIWLLVSMWLNTLTKSQIWTLLLKV